MTEQQYRVIADRDKGDDPSGLDVRMDDRWTLERSPAYPGETRVVRIERPVPTITVTPPDTPEANARARAEGQTITFEPSAHPPTREQIAEASYYAEKGADFGDSWTERWEDESEGYRATYYAIADAVLALFPQPTPSTEPVAAWRDRQGDVWTDGDDGLMHTRETAPFPREHVEKKWGPLVAVAAPPSIDDMAPGTTFTARFTNGTADRRFERTGFMAPVRLLPSRLAYWEEDIDPSTISDVTPPPATPGVPRG